MERIHTCSKCKSSGKISTFYAHKIPVPGDPEQYTIGQEWICTDCMTNSMANLVTVEMAKSDPPLRWFPLHSRISLEFEDEEFGSFSVRVWKGENLAKTISRKHYFVITGMQQLIFVAENLTHDESVFFTFQPHSIEDFSIDIKQGMDVAIKNLYAKLR